MTAPMDDAQRHAMAKVNLSHALAIVRETLLFAENLAKELPTGLLRHSVMKRIQQSLVSVARAEALVTPGAERPARDHRP